ncbi:MAG TPA: NAD(P)/FAD-dependent oxidoreductase [Acidobacteriaceae bacterium]|nr:NAD(P)/FAD-dependent oxidoreductase [Acidobacteriaceae bacterium]
MPPKRAVIIGAGPAGLTAALELLRRSDIQPIVLEATDAIGGLSQTVVYKGNRMDIGGHRFFSKSDRVMQWWLNLMPLATQSTSAHHAANPISLRYHGATRPLPACALVEDPSDDTPTLLLRRRKSRIYFLRRFFDYPVRLSLDTLRNLGPRRTLHAGFSYLRAIALPRRPETTLEDFLINRFGRQLYRIFFESYTEKVWGVPCRQIPAEWGAQRIKGLSLRGVLSHFLRGLRPRPPQPHLAQPDLAQKSTETSLIEHFLYPRLGPGQLWEHVAYLVRQSGGELHLNQPVTRLIQDENQIVAVETTSPDGKIRRFHADYVFSTMPVKTLLRSLSSPPPPEILEVSDNLLYRDFITVGLLASHLAIHEKDGSPLQDNWIYIQEPNVLVGRVQIFNNWSPDLVADPSSVWIGMEYFCNETDALWRLSDADLVTLASTEIDRIGLLDASEILDSHVVRVPKTYPAYFGSYSRFDLVRNYTDTLENLFLVGRNGMHKYNNQDHSMLTAMTAVDNILAGVTSKANLWSINTEMEYNEEK